MDIDEAMTVRNDYLDLMRSMGLLPFRLYDIPDGMQGHLGTVDATARKTGEQDIDGHNMWRMDVLVTLPCRTIRRQWTQPGIGLIADRMRDILYKCLMDELAKDWTEDPQKADARRGLRVVELKEAIRYCANMLGNDPEDDKAYTRHTTSGEVTALLHRMPDDCWKGFILVDGHVFSDIYGDPYWALVHAGDKAAKGLGLGELW